MLAIETRPIARLIPYVRNPRKHSGDQIAQIAGSIAKFGFSTQIVTLASCAEQRNVNWSNSRGRWNISTGIRSRADMAAVTAHFHAVKGRAYSFRFKDWNDFDATDQAMVQITLTVWQIVKRYDCSGYEHVRTITKPVAGSVAVKIAGSPVTPVILIFKLLQLAGIGHIHAAKPGFPFVIRGVADPVLAPDISGRHAAFLRPQYPDDLLFREPCLPHRPTPSQAVGLYSFLDQFAGLRSHNVSTRLTGDCLWCLF